MAQERRESSMLVRHGEKGWVDNVYVTESLTLAVLFVYGSQSQGS
jgi:DNA-directed RNA polymerase beta subunit